MLITVQYLNDYFFFPYPMCHHIGSSTHSLIDDRLLPIHFFYQNCLCATPPTPLRTAHPETMTEGLMGKVLCDAQYLRPHVAVIGGAA